MGTRLGARDGRGWDPLEFFRDLDGRDWLAFVVTALFFAAFIFYCGTQVGR